jgi:mannosyltransferase OCH1-like enzyme
MTIPKIIHNIWIQGYEHLPDDIREKHLKIKKMNPDWDFIIWDEKMILEILKKHPKIYNVYKNINSYSGFIGNMASRSDIARYVIMKEFGGLYYDMDFDCISPLDELFQSQSQKSETPAVYIASSKIEFLDYIYPFNKPKYCACFMALEKEHPVWEKVFKKIQQAKNKYDIGNALDRTLQENEQTYNIVNLEKVNGHYSCLSKNKVCYTPVESSWNIFRPLMRYMNC